VQPLHVCTLKYIRNDGIHIVGRPFFLGVVCEKHVVCGPKQQTLVHHGVAGALMRKKTLCVQQNDPLN
jgi:hypothetical protein